MDTLKLKSNIWRLSFTGNATIPIEQMFKNYNVDSSNVYAFKIEGNSFDANVIITDLKNFFYLNTDEAKNSFSLMHKVRQCPTSLFHGYSGKEHKVSQ